MHFLCRSILPFTALIFAAFAAPQAQETRVPAVESQLFGRRGYVIFEGKCAAVCKTNSDCTSACGGVCGASKICQPSEGRYEA